MSDILNQKISSRLIINQKLENNDFSMFGLADEKANWLHIIAINIASKCGSVPETIQAIKKRLDLTVIEWLEVSSVIGYLYGDVMLKMSIEKLGKVKNRQFLILLDELNSNTTYYNPLKFIINNDKTLNEAIDYYKTL